MLGASYYVFSQAVAGGEHVVVPNIINLPYKEAAARLADAGLMPGETTPTRNDQVPELHVIYQRPEAGRTVRAGRKVAMSISTGPAREACPDFTGQSMAKVEQRLAKKRFRLGAVARLPHRLPRHTVISQDPPPGLEILDDAEINFLVSDGSASGAVMPNIVGMRESEARNLLAPLGVEAVRSEVERSDADFGRVLSQQPAPGAELYRGQQAHYVVRAGAPDEDPSGKSRAEFEYRIPPSVGEASVRVDFIDNAGNRESRRPRDADEDGLFEGGDPLPIGFNYEEEATVEVYLDGRKARTYYFQEGQEPVIRDHDIAL
jgi:serine/threonine-protein kinase